MVDENQELRLKVATACRILGMLGLVNESTGHVSARIPDTDEMLIRCRGGNEQGITFTGMHNVRRTDFDGEGDGVGDLHASPNETPIHGEIYRAKPEAGAVVHAHPYYALLCGVTEMQYIPIFDGYDPGELAIVKKGVPVYPVAKTVTNKEEAAEMLKVMGERDVVLMRGHGISVYAATVERATTLAIQFDRLSRIMWDVALSGRKPVLLSPEQMDRGSAGGPPRAGGWQSLKGVENFAWNHYVKHLEVSGIGLPDDLDAD